MRVTDAYHNLVLNANNCDNPPFGVLPPAPCAARYGADWSDSSSDSLSQTSDNDSQTSDDSQSSEDTQYSNEPADLKLKACPSFSRSRLDCTGQQTVSNAVPVELRRNPRRSGPRAVAPPTLQHQEDRKVSFVDSLVDSTALMVEAIWPLSSCIPRREPSSRAVLPLRTFIQETLKRSRTSYSTLQVTMYYLILIKSHVKGDFTQEQHSDSPAHQALQCGRRIFLAALILASKYLQDRNYSARAWSKISGLNTQEINQNEMAFLEAVGWNLHITDAIWQRWTSILMTYRPPPSPPSPGLWSLPYANQCVDWKAAMLKLEPHLLNTEHLRPFDRYSPRSVDIPSPIGFDSTELPLTPTPVEPNANLLNAPVAMLHPCPYPSPKRTPQSGAFNTPAASVVPHLLTTRPSLGLTLQPPLSALPVLDFSPTSTTSSPFTFTARRSSLAPFSTTSSPESMISDASRSSRSSSISSASSMLSATTPGGMLGVPSRLRVGKLCSERTTLRPIVAIHGESPLRLTMSPEDYSGVADMVDETPLGRREREFDELAGQSATEAARTLEAMRKMTTATPARAGSKRMRSDSLLQDDVRELLSGHSQVRGDGQWSESLVRQTKSNPELRMRVPVPALSRRGSSKRLCCSVEALQQFGIEPRPSISIAWGDEISTYC